LFLDDLRRKLRNASTPQLLGRLRNEISRLKFLDPACGCGNFLMVAYRELRRLELGILKAQGEMRSAEGRGLQQEFGLQPKVTPSQFHGIELEEFPARIAATGMALIDHLA